MVDMVYYRQRKSTHSKVDAPEKTYLCPNGHRLFRWQTEQAFYFFFLFSLSLVRKSRNATIKLPKVINKVNIPINKDKISYAVIITHLPSYVVHHILLRSGIGSGGYHPVMGILFLWQSPRPISYHVYLICIACQKNGAYSQQNKFSTVQALHSSSLSSDFL